MAQKVGKDGHVSSQKLFLFDLCRFLFVHSESLHSIFLEGYFFRDVPELLHAWQGEEGTQKDQLDCPQLEFELRWEKGDLR
jgi:hypothetical protein